MKTPSKSEAKLLRENAELRARLDEAEETLRAIRAGEVDALVIGEQVYSLKGAETPYRILSRWTGWRRSASAGNLKCR